MPTYPQTDIEKKAWSFAKKAHEGMMRKFTGSSYFDGHVAKVFGAVKQFDTRQELGAAALLHDCVEDIEWVTYELLVEEFGKTIADLVQELTSDDEMIGVMGKAEYLLNKMATMSEDALIIKLCDRMMNISDYYRASKKFRDNYFTETKYIIDHLENDRVLNNKHRRIIEHIEGLMDNIKSRYQYENLKYIKLFEDFKQNNITIEDVVKCIDNGGVIYSKIVSNYPDHDPKETLNPVSIDEEGMVTVELDGKNYEVSLKNITKIEWN